MHVQHAFLSLRFIYDIPVETKTKQNIVKASGKKFVDTFNFNFGAVGAYTTRTGPSKRLGRFNTVNLSLFRIHSKLKTS